VKGPFGRLFQQRNNISLAEMDAIIARNAGGDTATGKIITPGTSLYSVPVFACVTILTDTISSLPLILYRRLSGGGKERATEHPLYTVLHDRPNGDMTSMEYRETKVGHLALWGNHYSEIERDPYTGDARALWPLRPDCMTPVRLPDGHLGYEYRLPNGEKKGFYSHLILHERLWGGDGITGYSPIRMARQAIALGQAAEEYGARFFGNDSRPGGVLEHPGKVTPEGAKRMKDGWEAAHRGLNNAQRVAVLEEGVKWQQVGIAPEDAQFLETRSFQTAEIARLFRIPPHLISDTERSTSWGTGIEQQNIGFVVYTIRPWVERIEQRLTASLLTPIEQKTLFVEHLLDGLVRGDLQSRYNAYSIGRQNGWLSADDIRELENMNPLPDGQGKLYLVPMNMIPASEMVAMSQSDAGKTAPKLPAPTDDGANGAGGTPARALLLPARTIMTPGELRDRNWSHAVIRRRIARTYRRLIVEATGRVLRREEADVMRQAEKQLRQRDATEFGYWLTQFYAGHADFVKRALLPVLMSLGDAIQADAADQIGINAGMTDELEQFVDGYTGVAASRYTWSSLGQLRSVLNKASGDGVDPLGALQTRFDEWEETRGDKMAMTHTVRESNAMTKEVWRGNGVRKIEWVTHGENCPFCNGLSGKIVGIEQTFAREGEDYQPAGADGALHIRSNIGHPPIHLGCDCSIAPD
jgi:HK97 family phage portal protein